MLGTRQHLLHRPWLRKGSARALCTMEAFLGQGKVHGGQAVADSTLPEVRGDALGCWKAAHEMERPSSTLSLKTFPSLRTESV